MDSNNIEQFFSKTITHNFKSFTGIQIETKPINKLLNSHVSVYSDTYID